MHEDLQRLIQELRAEKCPPRIFEWVAQRRACRAARRSRFRMASAVAAVGLATLLAVVLVWRRSNREAVSLSQESAPNRAQQVRVAEEAVAALAYIGNVLREAGEHTQNILLNEAVPPLRSGVQAVGKTTKNKI